MEEKTVVLSQSHLDLNDLNHLANGKKKLRDCAFNLLIAIFYCHVL